MLTFSPSWNQAGVWGKQVALCELSCEGTALPCRGVTPSAAGLPSSRLERPALKWFDVFVRIAVN